MLIIVYLFVNCLLDNCRSSFNTVARTFTTTSAHNAVIMCVIGMWVKPRFRTQDDPCCHVRGWPWMWYTDLWTCGWVDKYWCQVSSPADSSFHNYQARRRRSKCRSCLISSMMKSVGTNLQWNPRVPCITFLTHWRGRQMCVHPWTGRNWKITSTWYATCVYPQTNHAAVYNEAVYSGQFLWFPFTNRTNWHVNCALFSTRYKSEQSQTWNSCVIVIKNKDSNDEIKITHTLKFGCITRARCHKSHWPKFWFHHILPADRCLLQRSCGPQTAC